MIGRNNWFPALVFLLVSAAVNAAHAGVVSSLYWADASTSVSGVYNYESPMATQAGTAVAGAIPTDANQAFPDNDVVNYFRTLADLPGAFAAYDGFLLGNLSRFTGITATFSLSNSTLPAGGLFPASSIVGETYPDEVGNNAGIRLMFMGGTYVDPVYGVTPNEWWSRLTAAYVTSMKNGEAVTLTVTFDPSLWSNYYGHVGTESADTLAQFGDALGGVTRLGLSFGSGYFFSDGFAFNTGGTAQVQLDSIQTFTTPEPGTMVLFGFALGVLAVSLRYRRA